MSVWKQQFPQFMNSPKALSEVLLSGELPIAEYMKWASEHYKMPFLADSFFAQAKNFKLLNENPNPNWNEFFFPILEWQGMLYVGALEPQTVSLTKKVCVVLCSPQQLKLLWAKMEQPQAAPIPLAVPVGIPVIVPPTEAKPAVTAQAPAPVIRLDPPAPQTPAAAKPAPPTPKPEPLAPADPLAGILGSKFRLEETKSEVTVKAKLEDTKSSAGAPAFAGIGLQNEPITQVAPTSTAPAAPIVSPPAAAQTTPLRLATEKPLTDLKLDTKPPVPHQEPMVIATSHLKAQGVNVNPNFKENNYNLPEITNVVRAQPQKTNDTNFTSTKTIMPFPDRTTQFTFIRTVYSEQIIIEAKAKINENSDPQDALISAFRILKDYYKKLMWVVRDQKGQAFPIACNAAWDFTEEAWNLPMDFKSPNPFRIAKLTQKPFHGPVSKNAASDKFFKQWGDGTYPNTMSIVPVKLHGKVFGYFVGCEKGPHYQQQQSVELMESVCNELIQSFIRIHKELAKSA